MSYLRQTLSVASISALLATAATAQAPRDECQAAGGTGNACQLAADLFGYMHPQLGMLISGGNATLGQGGALGGLGKFAVTLRANATPQLSVPQIGSADLDGPVEQNQYATRSQLGAFPVADLAVGIFGGVPLGLTRAGGVDALINVFYVPSSMLGALDGNGYSFGLPDGGRRLGFGARIGLIEESTFLPGVSVTYIQRNLPKVSFTATTSGLVLRDTISVQNLEVRTAAWRLVAGKTSGPISVAVGYGEDRYRGEAKLGWVVRDGLFRTEGELPIRQSVTRSNMFADLSFNLLVFRVVGEIGRVSGGDIQTYNEFDAAAGRTRTYGAVGLRFGN